MPPPTSKPRRPRANVTLDDVARAAGVTRLSAHRAVHGQQGVSEATRVRIAGIVQQLGYRPNGAARAIRDGRYRAISLVVSKSRHRGFIDQGLLEGIADEADRHGLHLTYTALSDHQLGEAQDLPKPLRDGLVDGLLLNYHFDAPPALEGLIKRLGMPTVWLNADRASSCVRFDDRQAGRLATEHLLELGHRRIIYFDYTVGWDELPLVHYSNRERAHGYADALDAAGLRPRILRPRSHRLDPVDPVRYIRACLSGVDAPTAMVAESSDYASPIAIACAELGLSIPKDVSVIAIASERVPTWGPSLSLAQLSTIELGSVAVGALQLAISGSARCPAPILVKATLVKGATTGRPAPVATNRKRT